MSEKAIEVYADWDFTPAVSVGILNARPRGGGEVFDFQFSDEALADAALAHVSLDPSLHFYRGSQHPLRTAKTFGFVEDSSPDRWGRTLIERRFSRDRRNGIIPANAHLTASTYLLGVHDAFRSGAFRYRIDGGAFLDDRDSEGAPPFVRLREVEAASRSIEADRNEDEVDAALRVLLAPGASLGGARPKATVVDPNGHLWIAKFPSIRDGHDVGAWEHVVAQLAERCGIRIAEQRSQRFTDAGHTFLTRRFDRTDKGARIHFASAMTLTGRVDGDGAANGASYLDIAEAITSNGAAPNEDLAELWSRIVFNIAISNADDHLRNHGFLLMAKGWRLAPAFDVNPVPDATGLALNIDERDNALDFGLARSVAPLFRIDSTTANRIITQTLDIVRGWEDVATSVGLSRREREAMSPAFRVTA